MYSLSILWRTWLNSASLLAWSHVKQMLLLSARTLFQAFSFLYSRSIFIAILAFFAYLVGGRSCMFALFLFITACLIRSSVDKKNMTYLVSKIKFFPLFGGLFLIFLKFFHGFLFESFPFALRVIATLAAGIFFCITLFFGLDSGFYGKTLMQAPLNALRSLWYNVPLYGICLLVFTILGLSGAYCMGLTSAFLGKYYEILESVVIALYVAWCMALLYTIYLRRTYEQSNLYTLS